MDFVSPEVKLVDLEGREYKQLVKGGDDLRHGLGWPRPKSAWSCRGLVQRRLVLSCDNSVRLGPQICRWSIEPW